MELDTSMHEMSSDEAQAYLLDQHAYQIRTVMLAQCVSFDGKNKVTVQPLLQSKIDGVVQSLPPVADVPVAFFQAGGFMITHSPKPGDICELHIIDRSIEGWKLKGGITDPANPRHHDMNDAVAYFGLDSFNTAVAVRSGIDIRSRDGKVSIHVDTSTITTKVDTSEHILSASTYALRVGGTDIFTATASGAEFHVPVDIPQGATISNIPFDTHLHSGVESGPDKTGGPTT